MSMSGVVVRSERFEILEVLGEGGMGVVYRAFDRRRRHEVALKVLIQVAGAHLYRFKQEFRALTDVRHPNLVTLHELVADGDAWMFSMELLEGVGFLEHVRPYRDALRAMRNGGAAPWDGPTQLEVDGRTPRRADAPPTAATRTGDARTLGAPEDQSLRQALRRATPRLDRLRPALLQLAEGVRALHRAGKLHRDLKPSNVLVEPGGRVVILDFGLVSGPDTAPAAEGIETWGTPRYMSPEHATGAPQGEASDWYSLGVMLYEALTGRLPFEGPAHEVVARKCSEDPVPPAAVGSPGDHELEALTMALLARAPASRPSGDEIIARLRGDRGPAPSVRGEEAGPARAPFVGRRAELDALRTAFADARRRCVTVLVHGRSGMGKTALVRRFLDELTADPAVVVLAGRCYERESVPHGTLDAVVDALSSTLFAMTEDEVRPLVPRDSAALVRLFPVLKRVAILDAGTEPAPSDAQELRARAFAALRVLLTRLAERRPTVLFIDDLQWGDLDSGRFLLRLVHHPSAPSLLVLGTYRDDETSGPLGHLLVGAAQAGSGDVRTLAAEPLPDSAAHELARTLLARDDGNLATGIVAEAGGNPFFLAELARAGAHAGDEAPDEHGSRLAALVRRRIQGLEPSARRFLAVTALGGRPLPTDVASRAAGVVDEAGALAALRAESLVRVRRYRDGEEVETFHDRIRQVMAQSLPAEERRALHRALAETLAARQDVDPALLFEHWRGADDRVRARAAAIEAAREAEATFAFDRAARFYGLVLELSEGEEELAERPAWLERMGDAHADGSNLGTAAEAYLAAAEGLPATPEARAHATELRRRAFDALLCDGRLERGQEIAARVLEEVGLSLPRGARAALGAAALEKLRLAVRGHRFIEKPVDARDPLLLRRTDICRSLASGYSFVQPVTGALFHFKALRFALASGDPRRAGIALIQELASQSIYGEPARRRLVRAEAGIRALPGFDAEGPLGGFLEATLGLASFLRGDFAIGSQQIERGQRLMLADAKAYRWPIDLCKIYAMACLVYSGRIGELARMVPLLLRDARERGNEFVALGLRAQRSNLAWLALGEPDQAREHAGAIASVTGGGPFHLFHYFEMLAQCQIDLYVGDAEAAWQRLETAWPKLEGSLLLRMQMTRVESLFLRGRCALALANHRPAERERLTREVDSAVVRLRREKVAHGDALAALLAAMTAATRGQHQVAVAGLDGILASDAAGMGLVATVARRRRGELAGGAEGDAQVAAADAWLRSEHIRDPERMTSLWAPAPAR